MASTALLGSTGMVGAHILTELLASPSVSSVEAIARRYPLKDTSAPPKLTTFIETDTEKWASHYKSLSPTPSIFFSALATTKAAAGGFDNQYKLEHGLNIEMAKAAHEAGAKIYVLISAANANTKAMFAYSKMKGQIEEDVKAIGFDTTIILRPGLIAGYREESRPAEAAIRKVAGGLGAISPQLKDGWAQDADVIAKAAVNAAFEASNGKAPDKIWFLSGREIISKAQSG